VAIHNIGSHNDGRDRKATMNHSTATADSDTHIKIVALALVAAIMVVVVGFSARGDRTEIGTARAASDGLVIKAGKPTQFTTRSGIEIR